MKKRHALNLRRSTRTPPSAATSSSRKPDKSSGSSSSRYNLKWNLQSQHILNELGKFYFSGGEEGPEVTDVTLFSSEGDCVQAHKIVLMLCCPYFKNLFLQVSKTRRKEGDNAIVVLGNLSSKQLQNLVRFIYTGEVESASAEEKEEFIEIAKQFGIEGLSSTGSTTTPKKLFFKISEKTPPKNRKENPAEPIPQVCEDDNNAFINVIDASLAKERDDAVTCKIEPANDDVNVYEGDHEDFEPPLDADDDAGSNFSDQIQDTMLSSDDDDNDDREKDPDVSFGKPKKMKRDSDSKPSADESSDAGTGAILNWRSGRINGWVRLNPLSEEELKRDWRRNKRTEGKGNVTQFFYCAYGRKDCPAMLKIKTLVDGTDLYFKNNYQHDNHRGPEYHFGLTKEQKAVVNECLQNGVTQPSNIMIKFELAGMKDVSRKKLNNYLQRLKKIPEWGTCWTKREPKWPRRIRKKPEKTGPPKKLGRPTIEEMKQRASSAAASTSTSTAHHHQPLPQTVAPGTNDSASSSPTPHSSQGFLPHPNHFPGGLAFPVGIPPSAHHVVHHPSQFPY